MHTVVETPSYLRAAAAIFTEAESADIVALVATEPTCGEVMRGTGGFRKVRVGRKGIGKRGGARVVYILRDESFPVFLITAYPKCQKDNLTQAERNALKKRAEEIFSAYRSNR